MTRRAILTLAAWFGLRRRGAAGHVYWRRYWTDLPIPGVEAPWCGVYQPSPIRGQDLLVYDSHRYRAIVVDGEHLFATRREALAAVKKGGAS